MLNNITRHAKATRAVLTLEVSKHAVSLEIVDNGQGFDVPAVLSDPARGLGLRNMRERLDTLGEKLRIDSQLGCIAITAAVPWPLAAPNLQGHADAH